MKSEKIKSVDFNNHKKQIIVQYISGQKVAVHYRSLGISGHVKKIWVDKETRGKSVGIELDSGEIDYMPYDQPLAITRDPEFLLENHIEVLIAQIKAVLAEKAISKRYLAEILHTSDNQIQRLLNPKILNKNLSQLYHIAAVLGLELELGLKAA